MNKKKAAETQRARREMLGHLAGRSKAIPKKRLKYLITSSEGSQRRVWTSIAKSKGATA